MGTISDNDLKIKKAFRRTIKELYKENYSNCTIKEIKCEDKSPKDGIYKASIFTDISTHPHHYTFALETDMKDKLNNHNLSSKDYYDNEGNITYQEMDFEEYTDFSFYINGGSIQFHCREEYPLDGQLF